MDEKRIIERYINRPKTVAGEEFEATVNFTENPSGARTPRVDAFELEIGNTLSVRGEFVEPDLPEDLSSRQRFFATAEAADWLEGVEEGEVYPIKLRCLFEVEVEPEFANGREIVRKRSKKGFLILSGGEK